MNSQDSEYQTASQSQKTSSLSIFHEDVVVGEVAMRQESTVRHRIYFFSFGAIKCLYVLDIRREFTFQCCFYKIVIRPRPSSFSDRCIVHCVPK